MYFNYFIYWPLQASNILEKHAYHLFTNLIFKLHHYFKHSMHHYFTSLRCDFDNLLYCSSSWNHFFSHSPAPTKNSTFSTGSYQNYQTILLLRFSSYSLLIWTFYDSCSGYCRRPCWSNHQINCRCSILIQLNRLHLRRR